MPLPCSSSLVPIKEPVRLRSYRKESRVGEDHRRARRSRATYRSTFRPHVFSPLAKLSVREGMTISADQPSGRLAVRASQIPSQSSETDSGSEINPSVRVPAALI